MKLAIISDVHANLPALEAVLADIDKANVHRIICLGDIVGYGAQPNECCDILRSLSVLSVKGNHDLAATENGAEQWFTPPARVCILWTREQLSETNRRMLGSFPDVRQVEGVTLCHGSLVERDEYVYSWRGALPSFQLLTTNMGFMGHTHYACWFYHATDPPRADGEMVSGPAKINVSANGRYFVNPGAVGQPRDGNPHAAYVLYDDQLEEIEFRRVPYDIERAAREIINAGLPASMATRLFQGI
ncbi:MAG: metallophosphoesterase family protein [Candidatus Zipacnadales bacterium]